MLEDNFTWVLRKAFKGLALAPGEAASRAGLPENDVLALSRGHFSAETARRLAPALDLDADALAALPDYEPETPEHPDIHRLDLPFGDERVNAWLVRADGATVLFDAGHGRLDCLKAVHQTDTPLPEALFVTHAHADHTGGMREVGRRCVPVYGPPHLPGVETLAPGDVRKIGHLEIRACDLSGHADPSLGYFVGGLDRPVLVVGDAIFAGSMGGCSGPEAYRHALGRLHEVLDPLPDETILLPGHGPATTLGQERRRNPFFAS